MIWSVNCVCVERYWKYQYIRAWKNCAHTWVSTGKNSKFICTWKERRPLVIYYCFEQMTPEMTLTSRKAPIRGTTLISLLMWLTNSFGTGWQKNTKALGPETKVRSKHFKASRQKLRIKNKSLRHTGNLHILFIQRFSSWHVRQEHDYAATKEESILDI